MSEDGADSAMDPTQNPQIRCLSLAEKIISALNDPELVERYFSFKTKLFQSRGQHIAPSPEYAPEINTDRAYGFYQSLAQENQKLKDEIAELSAKKPDFSHAPENETIAAKLRELQRAILPKHKLAPKGDAVQEMDSLRKVIEAKLDSLNYLREKLRNDNQRLTADFREIERSLASKIEAAKEKEEIEKQAIESQERELSQELASAERELEDLTNQLHDAEEENQKLRQQHSDTTALLESMEAEQEETERQIEHMETESENMFEEIERLKLELSKKSKELNALQTLQRFGVEGDVEISSEIERLNKKAERLRSDNAQMSFELKRLEKRQQSTSVLGSSEALSLDEDELAAQILKSKWQ
jgi:chromosome segregation ATPase